jgi:hypothetical protein
MGRNLESNVDPSISPCFVTECVHGTDDRRFIVIEQSQFDLFLSKRTQFCALYNLNGFLAVAWHRGQKEGNVEKKIVGNN